MRLEQAKCGPFSWKLRDDDDDDEEIHNEAFAFLFIFLLCIFCSSYSCHYTKIRLKRGEKCNIYLIHACRQSWSVDNQREYIESRSFQPTLVFMNPPTFTADESHSFGWKLVFSICSLWSIYASWLSADIS